MRLRAHKYPYDIVVPGITGLMYAAIYNNKEIVSELIKEEGLLFTKYDCHIPINT